jgi:hypothetical protein
MGIIPASYAVVYPLAVMIASIDTVIALRGRLVLAWHSHSARNRAYHPAVI